MKMGESEKNEKERDIALKFNPELFDLLSKFEEVELEDVDMEFGDLEIWIQPGAVAAPRVSAAIVPPKGKPKEIIQVDFIPPIETYPGRIVEVKLGATKSEGGTRGKSLIVGGERSPAYYLFENSYSFGESCEDAFSRSPRRPSGMGKTCSGQV